MSRSTYALTWVAENMGDQHEALFVMPDTAEPERLVAATRRSADELGRAGLFEQQRGVHPHLLTTFRLLARPEVEFYGTVAHQQHPEPFTAVVAASGGAAVLAVLDADNLTLYPIRVDSLAEALVGVLPAVQPAHGQSITVPASAVDGPSGRHASGDEEFSVFAGQGRTDPAVARLRQLAAEPRTGGAQLHVAVRDQLGRRRRSTFPLNVIDVGSGRWFIHRQPNASGDVWVTAAPATQEGLAAKLYATHRTLSDAR